MKKAYALVTGIIFALFMLLIPFTGAFADSDPGISTAAFNATFGWYTGFPMVDSYGYLDINDWTITYQSNGTPSSNPSSGDVVYLYQAGDFVEISFSNWDLLSSYTTPVWCVQFGQNPSYSGNLQDAKYTLYQSYNTSECFYQYNRSFSYDNREIKWAHCFFAYPGGGITKIRIEYDGTPVIWNVIYIKFLGYRNEPNGSTYTQADLLQLQASISSTLSIARLADLIQLESSDIDLSTLEATTASILQKLADVPDILDLLTNIDSTDTQILTAINNFITYYYDYLSLSSIAMPYMYNRIYVYNNDYSYNNYWGWTATDTFRTIPADKYIHYVMDPSFIDYDSFSYIRIPIRYAYTSSYHVYIWYDNSDTLTNVQYKQEVGFIIGSDSIYIPLHDFLIMPSGYNRIHFLIYTSNSIGINVNSAAFIQYYTNNQKSAWYQKVLYYLHFLSVGDASVPSGIQQTTDTVTDQVNDIVDFEDTYNNSLETSASQIDVSSYEIQQTSGMTFMRTYTELNFDRMQNFRILFLTPLILALAAFFLRRRT